MWNRGKLAIVGIIVVALSAAGFSAWYHYREQHHALQFWGTTSALLIAEAPQVEIMRLGEATAIDPAEASDDTPDDTEATMPSSFEFGQQAWKVEQAKDALAAKGISNVRRALILDTTFDWRSVAGGDEPNWQYALTVRDKRNWATVLFDFDHGRVALTGARKTARLDPAANDDLKGFFAEQFAAAAADDTTGSPSETRATEPVAAPSSAAPDENLEEPPADKASARY